MLQNQIMSTVIYIVLIVILVIIVLVNIAPKAYDVSRSISINRPLPEVFSYLKFLKNQDNWSPWADKDPNVKKTFSGIDGEVGFVSAWVGNKAVGKGEQEITGIVENEVVNAQLRFLKPFKLQQKWFPTINIKKGRKLEFQHEVRF